MDGRSLSALAAVFSMLSLGVAGCIAPNDFLNAASTKGEISAMEDRDLADNAARAWSPDAKLGSVFGLELPHASDENQSGDAAWPTDPHPGNGKAPAWEYVYGNGNATRVFRVSADGRVSSPQNTSDVERDVGEAKPIGDWKVDSDKAMASAKSNETFAKAVSGANLTVAEGLAVMDGVTAYYFAGMSDAGMAFANVDASSGKVLSVKTFSMQPWSMGKWGAAPPMFGSQLHAEGKGSVDGQKTKQDFPITYEGGAVEATLDITATKQLPTDALSWSLAGPDGEKIKTGSVDDFGSQSARAQTKIDIPRPGEYKLTFGYRSDAIVPAGGVSFKWTLSSTPMDMSDNMTG